MARIVHRPEPPPDDDAPGAAPLAKPKPKLTPDEVRALLAVETANRPTPLKRTVKRGVILVPVGLLSLLFRVVFGEYAWIAETVITLAALVWIARPLFAKDDGWS
jgi:hypothetical protein